MAVNVLPSNTTLHSYGGAALKVYCEGAIGQCLALSNLSSSAIILPSVEDYNNNNRAKAIL